MNNFDDLYKKIMESVGGAMVAGGVGSALGTPSIPIGDTGGSFGTVDSWNRGSTVIAKPLGGKKYNKRNKPETLTGINKKKK